MTDQPDVAADTAPDHGYADDTDAVTSAPAEEHQPSEHSAPSEPSEIAESSSDPDGEPTGVPEVDALSSVLDDLDVLPIEDHVQVFAEAHERLHQALLSADEE